LRSGRARVAAFPSAAPHFAIRHLLFVTSCPLRHPLPSPFPSASRAEHFPFFHPDMRGWGAPTGASDACEASGFACHDRHAGAFLRRLAFPATGRSPRGAPPWRFSARARAPRCPGFPSGSCGDLVRRTGHRYPKERVSRASFGAVASPAGDATPRSTSRRLMKRPSMSEADLICGIGPFRSQYL